MARPSLSKKRSQHGADDSQIECPFSIRLVDPEAKKPRTKSKKRRKYRHGDDASATVGDNDDTLKNVWQQPASFAPEGAFTTHETMDVFYTVEPAKQWSEMACYKSFVLAGVSYYLGQFICVANETTIKRQETAGDKGPWPRPGNGWVAYILEIRASDPQHVYVRVFWMYWPDELPPGTRRGNTKTQGRQPYHGSTELIASNHMDIISVLTVVSVADVDHLAEDGDVQRTLYWRQALDVRTWELTSINAVCHCNQPPNPDKTLVQCSNETCGKWIHNECLRHYALMRTLENKVGLKTSPSPRVQKMDEAVPNQPCMDGVSVGSVEVGSGGTDEHVQRCRHPGDIGVSADVKVIGGNKLPTLQSFKGGKKPYDMFFDATLHLDSAPTIIEIRDLRMGVTGSKVWREAAKCPVCGVLIR